MGYMQQEQQAISVYELAFLQKLEDFWWKALQRASSKHGWLLKVCLDGFALLRNGSLLSDCLLGYRRARGGRRLAVLLFDCVLPLAKARAERHFERFLFGEATPQRFFDKLLVAAYPVFHTCYEAACLLLQAGYALGFTSYYSPLQAVSGSRLERLPSESNAAGTTAWLRRLLPSGILLAYSVETLHKQTSSQAAGKRINAPPMPLRKPAEGVKLRPAGCCQLCGNVFVAECCLPSGFRFCFACAQVYLQQHGCCPVTRQPFNSTELVRLYKGGRL